MGYPGKHNGLEVVAPMKRLSFESLCFTMMSLISSMAFSRSNAVPCFLFQGQPTELNASIASRAQFLDFVAQEHLPANISDYSSSLIFGAGIMQVLGELPVLGLGVGLNFFGNEKEFEGWVALRVASSSLLHQMITLPGLVRLMPDASWFSLNVVGGLLMLYSLIPQYVAAALAFSADDRVRPGLLMGLGVLTSWIGACMTFYSYDKKITPAKRIAHTYTDIAAEMPSQP